jgi:hypothetical protein
MELLTNEGKYVVVDAETIDCPFDSYEDDLQAGYDRNGVVPFLVKRISRVEPIQYFSRASRTLSVLTGTIRPFGPLTEFKAMLSRQLAEALKRAASGDCWPGVRAIQTLVAPATEPAYGLLDSFS